MYLPFFLFPMNFTKPCNIIYDAHCYKFCKFVILHQAFGVIGVVDLLWQWFTATRGKYQ